MPTVAYKLLNQNWFFRYKLYHLPFWLIYQYGWWVVALGNPLKAFSSLLLPPYTIQYSFYVLFQAGATYVNLYYLMPRYLEKSRFARYGSYLVLTIAVATVGIVSGYYFGAYASGQTIYDLFGPSACYNTFFSSALPATVASMTLALSIKLTKNWIQTRQRQQVLEKEKLETELQFLKNQFNPHFLFNTINSIFFLIHKNPQMASASLAQFSELLRYQLYECNEGQIPLGRELAYLENFIELEKLRQNPNMQVALEMDLPPVDHLRIAPFVLLSFVENAFKHVSRHANAPNWITIRVALAGQRLDFYVANSASPEPSNEAIRSGGLGLKNVQRRLDLLYPHHHELAIHPAPTCYTVQLQLVLTESVLTPFLQPA